MVVGWRSRVHGEAGKGPNTVLCSRSFWKVQVAFFPKGLIGQGTKSKRD